MIRLARGNTFSPVPIRVDAMVVAFRLQGVFESLDVEPVPGEEVTGLMNLQRVRCVR